MDGWTFSVDGIADLVGSDLGLGAGWDPVPGIPFSESDLMDLGLDVDPLGAPVSGPGASEAPSVPAAPDAAVPGPAIHVAAASNPAQPIAHNPNMDLGMCSVQ